jgi:UDPglucose 6-dehydrogenase
MNRIGVVGVGFVGGALATNFREVFSVNTYDKDTSKSSCKNLNELVDNSDVIFICVPTPPTSNGSCDTSIVREVCEQISAIRKDRLVVIKSTVTPKTTKILSEKTGLNISFNPEFLTEAKALQDFRHQNPIVIGADNPLAAFTLNEIYKKFTAHVGTNAQIHFCSSDEAEMFKYAANCFLATKVMFANELKLLCDKTGINYDAVAEAARKDSRLGATHWSVPGPDGKYGYGGSCFPKDMKGLLSFAKDNKSYFEIIALVEIKNRELRG